jgi:cobalt-zinc-cadmium efflux system protein
MENHIEKSLKIAIILTFAFFIVEVVGALVSGSLSLMGDAGHMFRDVFALFISLSAIKIAKKLPTKTKTFGYHRIEILAAFLNGIFLIIISVWILLEAYQRFFTPNPIESTVMFVVAFIGLVVNLYVAFKLHGSHDINVKSAFLHVLTDTLSSVAVIFASIWILFTNQTIVDPILGVAIAVFILFSATTIIKDSLRILMEFTPKDIDIDDVIREIESVNGVLETHNVHLWSLCSNINIVDAHVFTQETDMVKLERIKKEIKERLKKYNIKHATLEFECEKCMKNDKISKLEH